MSDPGTSSSTARTRATRSRTTAAAAPKKDDSTASKPKQPSRRVLKADVGKLSALVTSLPTEVTRRILTFVRPIDLFHFARSCKTFRRMILCNSALPIWKAAFENIGFSHTFNAPNSTFNQAQWANLMFGKGCTTCGKGDVQLPSFDRRERLCRTCRDKAIGWKGHPTPPSPPPTTEEEKQAKEADGKAIREWRVKFLAKKYLGEFGGSKGDIRTTIRRGAFDKYMNKLPYSDQEWNKDKAALKTKVTKELPLAVAHERGWRMLHGGGRPDDSPDEDDRERE